MQIANVMVAIGGERGNTVPRYGVTPAEIALLRAIHGDDAVFDIEPVGDAPISNGAERERLRAIYPAKDEDGNRVFDRLYPGGAARVYESLDELGLDQSYFKPIAYAAAPAPKVEVDEAAPAKKGKKANGKKAGLPPPPPAPVDDGDDLPELPADDAPGLMD